MKHTPGPWSYLPFPDDNTPRNDSYEIGTKGPYGNIGWRDSEYMNISGICREADAKLISAAPDMLDALVQITEYWNRDTNEQAMIDACNRVIEIAKSAIQRATGEE